MGLCRQDAEVLTSGREVRGVGASLVCPGSLQLAAQEGDMCPMHSILCLTYQPKETSNTVQKSKRKGVMRNQNTEEYVRHRFPNANNKNN